MKTDVHVDLLYSSKWNDITSDVLVEDEIQIIHGRQSETLKCPPSQMTLAINNTDGNYTSRNPNSALYGLIGRNQPIRCYVGLTEDDFERTVGSGWGTSSDGRVWSATGVGSGSTSVSGGLGVHVQTTTVGYRLQVLATANDRNLYRDCEARVLFDFNASSITGGDIEPANLILRYQDINNYYFLRVVINSSEAITLQIRKFVGGVESNVTDALTHSLVWDGTALMVSFVAEGNMLAAKLWNPANGEPFDYDLVTSDSDLTDPGSVGIRSGVGSGNSNSTPTFSYDNLEVRSYRFIGEVEAWPQSWEPSQKFAKSAITAYGLTRRLNGTGSIASRKSALLDFYESVSPQPTYYWTLEDQPTSFTASSAPATIGDIPLRYTIPSAVVRGEVSPPGALSGTKLITGWDPNSGDAAPTLEAAIAVASSATSLTYDFWFIADVATAPSGTAGAQFIISITNGSVVTTDLNLIYHPPSSEQFAYVRVDSTYPSAPEGLALSNVFDGDPHNVRVRIAESGSNTGIEVWVDGTSLGTKTVTSHLIPAATRMVVHTNQSIWLDNAGSSNGMLQMSLSHFAMWVSTSAPDSAYEPGIAYSGETASERLTRIGEDEGISVTVAGPTDLPMGPQEAGVLAQLQSAASLDGGILHDSRVILGLDYVATGGLLNQGVTFAASYPDKDITPPLVATEDSDHIANDVTAKGNDGAFARVVQEDGPLNVQEPSTDPDGVGRYAVQIDFNVEDSDDLIQLAAWRKHLGTWDEARYPSIRCDLTAYVKDAKLYLYNSVMGANTGNRFTVDDPPIWVAPNVIDQIIQGYSETIGSHHHYTDFFCSPFGPYETGLLAQDHIDSGTATLNASYDSDDVSLSVATTGARWIDSATYSAMFPFDIIVGGEVMTVTAISGTSSPQTFTVTRSVNDVVKSQSSGTEVHVYKPLRLSRK